MYKIIELYKKYKEIINYLVMGVLTTLVSIVSYFILSSIYDIENTIWFTIANLLSWIFAVIFAYVTNKKFVFESKTSDKKETAKEFILFVSSRISTFLIELLFMFLTVKVFLMNDKIAKVIAQVIVIVLNYLLSKIFVFKKK
ncbi:MAG: GtrA family protein [Clostridia bacterium]|nr:GtrA family protein [Clostridia bacterium]